MLHIEDKGFNMKNLTRDNFLNKNKDDLKLLEEAYGSIYEADSKKKPEWLYKKDEDKDEPEEGESEEHEASESEEEEELEEQYSNEGASVDDYKAKLMSALNYQISDMEDDLHSGSPDENLTGWIQAYKYLVDLIEKNQI
jgi:hypothetical protein